MDFRCEEVVYASVPTITRRTNGTASYWWWTRKLVILALWDERALCQSSFGRQLELPVDQLFRDRERADSETALNNGNWRRGLYAA